MSVKKYRPYFTLQELKTLEGLFTLGNITPANIGVQRYLKRYILDIESGFRKENHILEPTLIEKLVEKSTNHSEADKYASGLMTPQEETEYENRNGLR